MDSKTIVFMVVYKIYSLFLGHLFDTYHRSTNADTSSMRNIANYDVMAACGYKSWSLHDLLAPLSVLRDNSIVFIVIFFNDT